MGFAIVFGQCFSCGNPFGFNPHKVPSVRDGDGIRQPVCEMCVKAANSVRKKNGLPSIEIEPDAYEPIDEVEL